MQFIDIGRRSSTVEHSLLKNKENKMRFIINTSDYLILLIVSNTYSS